MWNRIKSWFRQDSQVTEPEVAPQQIVTHTTSVIGTHDDDVMVELTYAHWFIRDTSAKELGELIKKDAELASRDLLESQKRDDEFFVLGAPAGLGRPTRGFVGSVTNEGGKVSDWHKEIEAGFKADLSSERERTRERTRKVGLLRPKKSDDSAS